MYMITLYNSNVPIIVHGEVARVADAKITKEKNAIDSLVFTIYPNNDGYNALQEFATTVDVVDATDGTTAFEGRVISIVPSMADDGTVCKNVTCEDVEGYLNDSIQPYTEEQIWAGSSTRTGLQQYIDYLLDNHNSRVEDEKKIYRGEVDIDTYSTSENVVKGTNFERTWECLHTKLVDVFGGEMRVRRGTNGTLYLDYQEVLGGISSTEIRIAYNIETAERQLDPEQLITRLYPRGAKLSVTETDENGNEVTTETEERLSIADVNNGKAYIDDSNAMKVYGIIEGYFDWDDVTDSLNLLSKAKQWLEENNQLPITTTLTGYDLALIGLANERFTIYEWYQCYNDLVGLDERLEIVKQTIDINEPHASTIELGESTSLQSQQIARLEGLKGDVEYIKSQSQTNMTNVKNAIIYTQSSVEVAEDRIVATVGQQIIETTENIYGDINILYSSVAQLEITSGEIDAYVQLLDQNQQVMQSEIDMLPNEIMLSVQEWTYGELTEVYSYIDMTADSISAVVADLDDSVASLVMTTDSITSNVDSLTGEVSQIQQTANSITSVVSGLQSILGLCPTTAASSPKQVYISEGAFSYFVGATITVTFNYSNTCPAANMRVYNGVYGGSSYSMPTYNGSSSFPIYVNGSAITSTNGWKAGDVVSLCFDGSHWNVVDSAARSQIQQLADSITLSVSSSTGSATIELACNGTTNAISAKKALENDTSSITMTAGTITFMSNTLMVSNGMTSLDDYGSQGLYLSTATPTNCGLAISDSNSWLRLQNGRIFGSSGGAGSSETGYIAFNSYCPDSTYYGTRVAGRGLVSFHAPYIGIGGWVASGSDTSVTLCLPKDGQQQFTFLTKELISQHMAYSTTTIDGVKVMTGISFEDCYTHHNMTYQSFIFEKGFLVGIGDPWTYETDNYWQSA